MSERMIPASEVHEILANRNLGADEKIAEIESILPAPALPTLADMSEEARAACQWMQADTGRGRALVIGPEWVGGHAELLDQRGNVFYEDHSSTIPRPDLPRFEWPVAQEAVPATALPGRWRFAEHPEYGRVIVTRPTQDSDGSVLFVIPSTGPLGYDRRLCKPDDLKYLDNDREA